MIVWLLTVRADVLYIAEPLLSVNVWGEKSPTLSVRMTVPVGVPEPPDTLMVKVTLFPTTDGVPLVIKDVAEVCRGDI